jgi:Rrf2 family protein
MFSKACEYGIKASIIIAQETSDESRIGIREIAKKTNSPEAFTAKILQLLTKAKVLYSIKGPNGGFYLPKESSTKTYLSKIVEAIDGDQIFRGCALGLNQCDAKRPCPVHDKFVDIRDDLQEMLETTTIFELANGLKNGETYLVR